MRNNLLQGILDFPGTKVLEQYPELEDRILDFWKAIWTSYLHDNETNSLFWYEELGAKPFNDIVRRLCHHGWIQSNSLTGRRWASIELKEEKLLQIVSPDELEQIKADFKYNKYLLDLSKSKTSTLVRQNGQTKRTGLVRKGFKKAGDTQFGYDIVNLSKYEASVKLNLTKSMNKIRKYYPEMKSSQSSYDEVSCGIFDWHMNNPDEIFTTGNNINDSRGRAISNALRKVANPIGNKDFRAALVITYEE